MKIKNQAVPFRTKQIIAINLLQTNNSYRMIAKTFHISIGYLSNLFQNLKEFIGKQLPIQSSFINGNHRDTLQRQH